MPSGVYNHLPHKLNCCCAICKAKRGETKGENCPMFGKHWYQSEETIKKKYESRKNNGKPWHSEETKQKMRKPKSEEHIRKVAKANTGKKRTEEQNIRNSEAQSGKILSEETIQKMIKSHTGHIVTKETAKKIGIANTGKIRTEEVKRKWSESKKGKKLNHKSNCLCSVCKAKRGEGAGKNHPQWQGGLSNLPYPFNFNEELKELIRKRDNYTCQLCGRTKEDTGRKLAVHHIDYIKENLDPNNLLTLCNRCNVKVNCNRSYWIEFFRNKIKDIQNLLNS